MAWRLANFKIERLLVPEPIDVCCIQMLNQAGIETVHASYMSKEELKNKIKDFDGLIVRSVTKVTAEIIEAGTRLRVIGRAGTGVDNIDVEAATKRGIVVFNTPGGNTISAAEHTVALLCSVARSVPQAHSSLKSGKWDRKSFIGTELHGKTLGILGLGRIGREVAIRMQSFGMKTIGFDPILPEEIAKKHNIHPMSFESVLSMSDFITVHTPLTNETKDLLNDQTFALCKDGFRVVNCARGGIIDESALLRVLQSKKCSGAALDVFVEEPPKDPLHNPLLQHPNVISTPHLGASTEEAQNKVAVEVATSIIALSQGKEISGLVNAPSLTQAFNEDIRCWITLAFQLGDLLAQILSFSELSVGSKPENIHQVKMALQKLDVVTQGKKLEGFASVLRSAVLSGLLSHLCNEPVNLVNAQIYADEMGLQTSAQTLSHVHPNCSNLLTLIYEVDGKSKQFCATVYGKSSIRLVQVDDFHCEIEPQGNILFVRSLKQNGVKWLGVISSFDIHVAFMSLGRNESDDLTLTIIGVDGEVPLELEKKLLEDSSIVSVKVVHLKKLNTS